jgi:hypothetical protein
MSFVSNPIYVLGVLSFMVILSIYAGKTKLGKQFGAALLVILFTAVVANQTASDCTVSFLTISLLSLSSIYYLT